MRVFLFLLFVCIFHPIKSQAFDNKTKVKPGISEHEIVNILDALERGDEPEAPIAEKLNRNCGRLDTREDFEEVCDAWVEHNQRKNLSGMLENLKREYAENPEKLKRLQKAQEAWEAFVKAQMDLLYFDHAGSDVSMCRRKDITHFFLERNKQLQLWLKAGAAKGDVCGGL